MGNMSFGLSERLAAYHWHAREDGVAHAFDPKGEHGEFSFCGMPIWSPLGSHIGRSLCRDCTRRIDFLAVAEARVAAVGASRPAR
jgi:hypothetical protein